MSLSDPVGDMLARIKNAQVRNHSKGTLPSSSFKAKIADVLKSEGYIIDYKINNDKIVLLLLSVFILKSLINPSFLSISAIFALKLEEGKSTFL